MCNCKTKCKCSPKVTFDPSKPVQCRDGKKARIIATDSKARTGPIVALVEIIEDVESPYTFTAEGKIAVDFRDHPFDLLNIPHREEEYRTFVRTSSYQMSPPRSLISSEVYKEESYLKVEILKFSYEDDKLISVEIIP